jgi:hypothetical protein
MDAGRKARRARAFVAFLAHLPGLWLCYGTKLGPTTKRDNVLAISTTLLSMLAAWLVSHRGLVVLIVWAVGHACWGAWLSRRVLADSESR